MSNVISHDTAGMRKWSGSMENLADDYDSLVARLYATLNTIGDNSTVVTTALTTSFSLLISESLIMQSP